MQFPDRILEKLKNLPEKPGIYLMRNRAGKVIYVGKAKSLKKRVLQYAQGRFHTQRIALMVDLTRSMEFVVDGAERHTASCGEANRTVLIM